MTTNFIFKYLFFVMGFAGFIHVGRSEQFIVEAGAGGNDLEFEPREPWARRHSPWAAEKQAEWEKLAGKPWMNLIGRSLYRDYNKRLDIWDFDHRGSLNAVYAFLRELGARWYMPGELGEILPTQTSIALPQINRTVAPDWEIRSISRPLISSNELEDALWHLRIGANKKHSRQEKEQACRGASTSSANGPGQIRWKRHPSRRWAKTRSPFTRR